MTVGKAAVVTACLVGVVALGVATTPAIHRHWSRMHAPVARAADGGSTDRAGARPARHAHPSPSRTPDTVPGTPAMAAKKESNTINVIAVSAWNPELRQRVKAVLNPGAKPEIAAADFANAEEFMTVAHAARNTQVPFMVLKDRVVNQGQSLAQAIHEFKPDLDARAEVTRARAAAREDLESAG